MNLDRKLHTRSLTNEHTLFYLNYSVYCYQCYRVGKSSDPGMNPPDPVSTQKQLPSGIAQVGSDQAPHKGLLTVERDAVTLPIQVIVAVSVSNPNQFMITSLAIRHHFFWFHHCKYPGMWESMCPHAVLGPSVLLLEMSAVMR